MGAYNLVVARGWESKSVEQQQEEATTSAEQRHTQLTPEQIADARAWSFPGSTFSSSLKSLRTRSIGTC
jgi:hypothetical protein